MTEHRGRRWPWIVGAAALVLVLAAGGVITLYVVRDRPGEQSVDDMLDEFRDGGDDGDGGSAEDRPPAGVYEAEGEGEATLSLLGLAQQDGPSIPITVTHDEPGCWSVLIDLNDAHRQTNRYCRTDDGRVVEGHSETDQEWDLGAVTQENHTEFTCEPDTLRLDPDAEPGQTWPHRCTGENTGVSGTTTSEGTYTYVGEDELEVDGEAVAVEHYRQQRTISGAQEGEQTVDHWYTPDGLLVREERTSQVRSDSPIGAITYADDGWWQLISLTPRT